MSKQTYIAIDIESTGLDPKTDRIIEVGAYRVEEGHILDQYHTMIDPCRALKEHIVTLTGITDDMLRGAPQIGDVIREITDFCEGLPLLGHHVISDYSFIKRAAVNAGLSFEHAGLDTLYLCRKFMPEEQKKNLQAACEYYGVIRDGAHRALGDALDTHRLYELLEERYEEESPESFEPRPLIYKIKREFPATNKQKEHLQRLLKCHRIDLPVQIDSLSRNEISRITDKVILQYGRLR